MSREGSLEAPTRHPLDWQNEDFYDRAKLDAEMERVFDICHGCRRCFNLCDSFPRLFDLVDQCADREMRRREVGGFRARSSMPARLCDMCFMTKCPYVPPHRVRSRFPASDAALSRGRSAARASTHFAARQLAEMDRNGTLAQPRRAARELGLGPVNKLTRAARWKRSRASIAQAELPKFHARTFIDARQARRRSRQRAAPAFGKRKAVLYATCFVNYNQPVDRHGGARACCNTSASRPKSAYPGCCGMPFLEQADLARVARQAEKVSSELMPLDRQGLRHRRADARPAG